jgi:hypothetical protein
MVAVHGNLRQPLTDTQLQRRTGKPGDVDPALQFRLVQRRTERQRPMGGDRKGLQCGRREITRCAERELTSGLADGPHPGALRQVEMVEACKHVRVPQRHRERLERPPVFRVRPSMVGPDVSERLRRGHEADPTRHGRLADPAPTSSRVRDGEGLRAPHRSSPAILEPKGFAPNLRATRGRSPSLRGGSARSGLLPRPGTTWCGSSAGTAPGSACTRPSRRWAFVQRDPTRCGTSTPPSSACLTGLAPTSTR